MHTHAQEGDTGGHYAEDGSVSMCNTAWNVEKRVALTTAARATDALTPRYNARIPPSDDRRLRAAWRAVSQEFVPREDKSWPCTCIQQQQQRQQEDEEVALWHAAAPGA